MRVSVLGAEEVGEDGKGSISNTRGEMTHNAGQKLTNSGTRPSNLVQANLGGENISPASPSQALRHLSTAGVLRGMQEVDKPQNIRLINRLLPNVLMPAV